MQTEETSGEIQLNNMKYDEVKTNVKEEYTQNFRKC